MPELCDETIEAVAGGKVGGNPAIPGNPTIMGKGDPPKFGSLDESIGSTGGLSPNYYKNRADTLPPGAVNPWITYKQTGVWNDN